MVAYAGTTSEIKCECVCIELEPISDRASLKGSTWEKNVWLTALFWVWREEKVLEKNASTLGWTNQFWKPVPESVLSCFFFRPQLPRLQFAPGAEHHLLLGRLHPHVRLHQGGSPRKPDGQRHLWFLEGEFRQLIAPSSFKFFIIRIF